MKLPKISGDFVRVLMLLVLSFIASLLFNSYKTNNFSPLRAESPEKILNDTIDKEVRLAPDGVLKVRVVKCNNSEITLSVHTIRTFVRLSPSRLLVDGAATTELREPGCHTYVYEHNLPGLEEGVWRMEGAEQSVFHGSFASSSWFTEEFKVVK